MSTAGHRIASQEAMLRPLIVTCFSFTLVAAELPAVTKVLSEVAKAEEAASKVYDTTLVKAKEKAIADLVKIQDGLTKKGDLDGALLVRNTIAELSADIALLGNPSNTLSATSADALAKRIAAGATSADDYGKMAGREFTIDARALLDTKVVLHKGDRYLVFPHPNDTWAAAPRGEHAERVNYRGRQSSDPELKAGMSLVIRVGEAEIAGFIAHGEGPLVLGPKDDITEDNLGEIRIKLVKIR